MKKYWLFLALLCTQSCFAFPPYNSVSCYGLVNGHKTSVEYSRLSRVLRLTVDGQRASTYANENGNRIYINLEYDEYGDSFMIELLSTSTDWSATFNIYINNKIEFSGAFNCQRLGLAPNAEQKTSVPGLLSVLKN